MIITHILICYLYVIAKFKNTRNKFINVYKIEQEKREYTEPHKLNITRVINGDDVMKYIKNLKPNNRTNINGYDHRFPMNNTEFNQTVLENIYKNNERKKLLSILMNNKVPYTTKLELIILNQHLLTVDTIVYSIQRGGLFDDYDFEPLDY